VIVLKLYMVTRTNTHCLDGTTQATEICPNTVNTQAHKTYHLNTHASPHS